MIVLLFGSALKYETVAQREGVMVDFMHVGGGGGDLWTSLNKINVLAVPRVDSHDKCLITRWESKK